MRILVCISNVPDTTTKVKFSADNTSFDDGGVQWIINPWDELALTRAMELKEDTSNGVSRVTVVSVGPASVEPTLRKALAIGADDAIRVDGEAGDAHYVAAQLASVAGSGDFGVILCGIESSDYNGSAVGGMLSEILDVPSVSAISGLTMNGEEVTITRDIDGGKEEVSVPAPFVGVVQKGIAKEPRIAAMRGIMMARKKPLQVVPAVDAETLTETQEFAMPEPKAPCKMVEADNVKELVGLLQNEAKVL
ncbi:MAG: electron transfer flavoprotein subunit beta/FixA family protein [Bacteroidales bacterium]|nr:electron transfer flavoprotein subunit beta/FixA family protein [Bacteroidales bacterium]